MTDERIGKTTRKSFYTWTRREVRNLYGQTFQFAYDVARQAERALQHEIGDRPASFLQYGYLSGKEGLLAGERLQLDLKRMELAYHDLNQREYELTKHISVLQLDPVALVELRATGACTISLPEELFDPRRPRPLLPPDQAGGGEHPLRGRGVRQRQLHADAAVQHHSDQP
jgi:Tc toxin complex TcA C-terminal TcB-binding domain